MSAALNAARAALRAAGYDLSSSSDDERLVLAVSDAGGDDPEAAATLEAIRALVSPLGCEAEWTGSGDTWGDGESTSDIAIYSAGSP